MVKWERERNRDRVRVTSVSKDSMSFKLTQGEFFDHVALLSSYSIQFTTRELSRPLNTVCSCSGRMLLDVLFVRYCFENVVYLVNKAIYRLGGFDIKWYASCIFYIHTLYAAIV